MKQSKCVHVLRSPSDSTGAQTHEPPSRSLCGRASPASLATECGVLCEGICISCQCCSALRAMIARPSYIPVVSCEITSSCNLGLLQNRRKRNKNSSKRWWKFTWALFTDFEKCFAKEPKPHRKAPDEVLAESRFNSPDPDAPKSPWPALLKSTSAPSRCLTQG